jgi:hypothetical protein
MAEQLIAGLSSQYVNAPKTFSANDTAKFGGIKSTGAISYTSLADSTKKGAEPTVAAINTANKLQDTKLNQQITKQAALLSDSAYSVKLQQEMVAMLGLNAQFLRQISDNTTNNTEVNINGKVLHRNLFNEARRNYGVARTT